MSDDVGSQPGGNVAGGAQAEMLGELCAGYRITGKLGEGATGETYLAEHPESGQKVVVKVLFRPLCTDATQVGQFISDVQGAARINHVGIADIHGAGVHANGRAFVVGEHLPGKTLTDAMIELGSVSDMASFADIAWQLATMLAAAHESKIVHGALKPDAIFLTFPPSQAPRPLVKLVDFGMSRFTLGVRQSQTGSLLGAPLYMSPEIGRGLGHTDHRSDVYSLGCILFEMACGRPPFVREGRGELIIAHATESAPPVSELEPSVPAAVATLIGRMLTKQPSTRPQSMVEVAGVLEKFFDCPTAGAVAYTPAPATPSFSAAALPVRPGVLPPPAPVPMATASQSPSATAVFAPRDESPSAPVVTVDAPVRARAVEPTALLPPSPQAWLARVHQRTTVLDEPPPISGPAFVALSGASGNRPARSGPRRSSEPRQARASGARAMDAAAPRPVAPRAGGINLPVVIGTACVVLVISAIVIMVARRKPEPTKVTAYPPESQATPAFVPPPQPSPGEGRSRRSEASARQPTPEVPPRHVPSHVPPVHHVVHAPRADHGSRSSSDRVGGRGDGRAVDDKAAHARTPSQGQTSGKPEADETTDKPRYHAKHW
jgi:serine/threonine protein kinase